MNYQYICKPLLSYTLRLLFIVTAFVLIASEGLFAQAYNIILGRPTDSSMTASILIEASGQCYLEYGTVQGMYGDVTPTYTFTAAKPEEIDMTRLQPNTRYYYRLWYRVGNASVYAASPEYSFMTQRVKNSTFTFTLEADEHLYDKKGVKSLYQICLQNQANDKPDFMMSLGDIFGDDHEPFAITSKEIDSLHKQYRPFLGSICHSIPFYVCLGNHEGENDYYLSKTPPNNLTINGTLWRKFYYPNPFPNGFYTGNTDIEPYGVGYPENYYAWTWGDALFVVLDVYRDQCDTSDKPQNWAWSLGLPQYTWLKNTLERSTAKYKFVFAHHIRGQGRGGITNAKLFEWGGYEQNGRVWGFDKNRPGWAKPIHKLFVDTGVNIFFQGHDHVFAHEILDGVTYQALPMPSDSTYQIGKLANADAYTADTLDGSGHIRVTVSPQNVKVDYVQAYLPKDTIRGVRSNGQVAFSYTVKSASATSVQEQQESSTISVSPNPAYSTFTLQIPEQMRSCTVRLMNVLGQTVLQQQAQGGASSIDISTLPNGTYILNISDEGFRADRVVVIHH